MTTPLIPQNSDFGVKVYSDVKKKYVEYDVNTVVSQNSAEYAVFDKFIYLVPQYPP